MVSWISTKQLHGSSLSVCLLASHSCCSSLGAACWRSWRLWQLWQHPCCFWSTREWASEGNHANAAYPCSTAWSHSSSHRVSKWSSSPAMSSTVPMGWVAWVCWWCCWCRWGWGACLVWPTSPCRLWLWMSQCCNSWTGCFPSGGTKPCCANTFTNTRRRRRRPVPVLITSNSSRQKHQMPESAAHTLIAH